MKVELSKDKTSALCLTNDNRLVLALINPQHEHIKQVLEEKGFVSIKLSDVFKSKDSE